MLATLKKRWPLTSPRSIGRGACCGDHPRRRLQVERDAEAASQVVGGAERQDAERQPGLQQPGDGARSACRRRRRAPPGRCRRRRCRRGSPRCRTCRPAARDGATASPAASSAARGRGGRLGAVAGAAVDDQQGMAARCRGCRWNGPAPDAVASHATAEAARVATGPAERIAAACPARPFPPASPAPPPAAAGGAGRRWRWWRWRSAPPALLGFAAAGRDAGGRRPPLRRARCCWRCASRARPAQPIGPAWLAMRCADLTALGGIPVLGLLALVGAGLPAAGPARRAVLLLLLVAARRAAAEHPAEDQGFDRPRPALVAHLVEVQTASFPSGHAMLSAVGFLTLGALLAGATPQRRQRAISSALAVAADAAGRRQPGLSRRALADRRAGRLVPRRRLGDGLLAAAAATGAAEADELRGRAWLSCRHDRPFPQRARHPRPARASRSPPGTGPPRRRCGC